ncbi:hypothetical protein AB5I41_17165 [Sphingomonas sp. MMS24-JH45]
MVGSLILVVLVRWAFGRLIDATIGPRIITNVLIVDDLVMEAPGLDRPRRSDGRSAPTSTIR